MKIRFSIITIKCKDILCLHSKFAIHYDKNNMLITESKFSKNIKFHKAIGIGELYFFENYIVAEFNEGVDISFDNLYKFRPLIKEHFGSKGFGFISNRINSYSILITDAPSFFKEYPNLKAYAVVSKSPFTEKIFEIENHFFKFNRKYFTSLTDAVNWVEESLL